MQHVERAALEKCQRIIGYTFTDQELLSLALTHASIATTRVESNERLEFLGDAVLALVICHDLFDHADELLEGEMTKVKSAVVSRATCADIAAEMGIADLISLGKGMVSERGLPTSVLAAVFESVIGAIYLDGGLEPARGFILAHVAPHLQEALVNEHRHNYKSLLQQHSQRRWGNKPDYLLLDEKGPDHCKCFEVAAVIDGVHFPSAWGMNKKEAEQEAARQALVKLDLLPGGPDTDAVPLGPQDQQLP